MRQVVLQFPARVSDDKAGINADMQAFAAWSWTGADEISGACEIVGYTVGGGFPMAPVRYSQADAEALLKTLKLATRIFVVDYEAAAREKAARAAAKRQAAERLPDVQPSPRELVPPSLRFMLCVEAMSEGDLFYRRTELLGPIGLKNTADQLSERYPYIGRLDECLGGAIRRCLRAGADVQPPAGGPYPWRWIGIPVKNGWPLGVAKQIDDAMEKLSTFPLRSGQRRPVEFDDPDCMEVSDSKFFGTADAHGDPDESEQAA